jgi:hypothetical protein
MENNQSDVQLSLQTKLTQLALSQWHSLGCENDAKPHESYCIDLEALIMFTCVIGQDNTILFDNMIGWLFNHSDLVNTGRLITMVDKKFPQTSIQKVLEVLARDLPDKRWKTILTRKSFGNKRKAVEDVDTSIEAERVSTDFAEGGLPENSSNYQLNDKITSTSESSSAIACLPKARKRCEVKICVANFQMMMRFLVGVNTRAEILTYFAAECREITASELARALNYHQSVLFSVLSEMAAGGFVIKRTGDKVFYMPNTPLIRVLCSQVGGNPKWLPWLTVYRFLIDVQNLLNDIDAKKYCDAIEIDEASRDFLLNREGELKRYGLNRFFPKAVIYPHGGYLEAIKKAISKLLTEFTCQPKKSTVKKNKATASNKSKQETAQVENNGSV